MRKKFLSIITVFFLTICAFGGCTKKEDIHLGNVLIFGDSYSTYQGFVPEGFRVYYSPNGIEGRPAVSIMKVEETWWHQVISLLNSRLILNNSWSGSTIGYTGYDGDCSQTTSFIYRFRKLKKEGFFKNNTVDTVFLFGATNDSWADAPLGEMMFSDWEEKDLYNVLPAICHFIGEMKKELPKAEIYFLINTGLKEEIENCIKQACEYFSVKTIKLSDIDKECGHPSVKGMKTICEQVLNGMNK